MPNDSLEKFVDALSQRRFIVQFAGLVLAAAGYSLVRWLAPLNFAAHLCAGLAGLALILFAQYFHFLQKLGAEDRRSLARAGIACLLLCVTATIGAAGYFLTTSGKSDEDSPTSSSQQAVFSNNDPNQIQIRFHGALAQRQWSQVVVEVQKIWSLTPDKAPAVVDLDVNYDLELPADKKTPYTVESGYLQSIPGRLDVKLQPILPSSVAATKLEDITIAMVRRVTFTKKPKDFVYLLRLRVMDADGGSVNAGTFLYLPDLKTTYSKSASAANLSVLRELKDVAAIKSPKLADLLKANALLLDSKKTTKKKS